MLDRSPPEALADDAHLVAGLGRMGHQHQPVPLGQFAAAHKVFGRDRIGGMGRHGDAHARRSCGPAHGLADLPGHLVEVAVEVVAAEQGPDAEAFGHLDAAVLEIVHVHERGHAAEQHLDDAEFHAQSHIIGGLARLEGPDVVVEPPHERDVVGIAALERHGRMAVRIDQSRHDEPAPAVDLAQAGVCGAELRHGPLVRGHQRDPVARDAHRPGERPCALPAHGEQRRI